MLVFAADRIVARAVGDLSRADIAVIIGGSAILLGTSALAVGLTRPQYTAERLAELLRVLPGQRRKSPAQLRATGASWHHDIQQRLGPRRNR